MTPKRSTKRVLATRPAEQNTRWCEQLQASGFTAMDIPLLEIVPVLQPGQLNAVKQVILDFDLYYAVIFVSQNAVSHAARWIHEYWPQLPVGIHYFAVGLKTAETLQAALDLTATEVNRAGAAMNSETLLQLPTLQNIAQQKILICRGVGGRPLLGNTLAKRGAQVEYCELYERQLPAVAAAHLEQQRFNKDTDIITVFSGETLTNLIAATHAIGKEKLHELQALPIIVPGERVAQQAEAEGFKQILVAINASEQAMLQTLTENF